jgi:hypothetical protein
MGKEPPHVWTVDPLETFLPPRLSAARWALRRESPVQIPKFDGPESDLVTGGKKHTRGHSE